MSTPLMYNHARNVLEEHGGYHANIATVIMEFLYGETQQCHIGDILCRQVRRMSHACSNKQHDFINKRFMDEHEFVQVIGFHSDMIECNLLHKFESDKCNDNHSVDVKPDLTQPPQKRTCIYRHFFATSEKHRWLPYDVHHTYIDQEIDVFSY